MAIVSNTLVDLSSSDVEKVRLTNLLGAPPGVLELAAKSSDKVNSSLTHLTHQFEEMTGVMTRCQQVVHNTHTHTHTQITQGAAGREINVGM